MTLDFVNKQLLEPNQLQLHELRNLLEITKNYNIDYSDLYFQSCLNEYWVLEDNIIKSSSYDIKNGVGIRTVSGEQTGFAYTNQLTLNALQDSIKAAISIASTNGYNNLCINKKKNNTTSTSNKNYKIYPNINPISSISNEEKIELLIKIDKTARSEHSYVKKVQVILSGTYDQIIIIATDGTLASDIRPLIRLLILVQVERNGKRDQGVSGGGSRNGYHYLLNHTIKGEMCIDHWTRHAVQMGLTNLDAIEAPAGTIPVVLGSGWPGILIHEAVGHGLEADFNRKGSSIFSNKLEKQVTSELCTIVDDATINSSRGSLNVDDEGTPGQYNILIKNGMLKKYMQDKLNAQLMETCPTGNGRRASYADLPMPRMTNTYMLPGTSTREEIIDSVDYGIYAINFGGGQVDITSGKFVFSTSEAFLIEKGVITKPIKGATLIGSGIDIMQNISMVGNDFSLDSGMGICVKNGQQIPVSVGQPTIKLNKITVGGTN